MIYKVIFTAAAAIQIFSILSIAYKYDFVLRDEEIFTPCSIPNANFFPDYVDFSNLNFESLINGSIHVHGEAVVLKDVGSGNTFAIEVYTYKKDRDTWVNTIYSIRRPDACKTMFDTSEFWGNIFETISKAEDACPFSRGHTFYLNIVADMIINLPNPFLAGEYKIEIIVNFKNVREVFCGNIIAEAYRV